MKPDEIQLLYRYNAWANARILKAASNLTLEQFLAPSAFSHGGLRSTLVHTLFAEWIWRRRWEGHSPAEWLMPEDFPTFESLQTRWLAEEKELLYFVEQVSEGNLASTIHYKSTGGRPHTNTLWHLMAHLVNHGTQHRSEAAVMLTDFGHSPGDIDLIMFLRENS